MALTVPIQQTQQAVEMTQIMTVNIAKLVSSSTVQLVRIVTRVQTPDVQWRIVKSVKLDLSAAARLWSQVIRPIALKDTIVLEERLMKMPFLANQVITTTKKTGKTFTLVKSVLLENIAAKQKAKLKRKTARLVSIVCLDKLPGTNIPAQQELTIIYQVKHLALPANNVLLAIIVQKQLMLKTEFSVQLALTIFTPIKETL